MARYEIVCITKRGGHFNPHERISHVGIRTTQGREKYTSEQVVSWIDNRVHRFYVSRGGRTIEVVTAVHNGRRYLKTEPDAYSPDNLLALPEC